MHKDTREALKRMRMQIRSLQIEIEHLGELLEDLRDDMATQREREREGYT